MLFVLYRTNYIQGNQCKLTTLSIYLGVVGLSSIMAARENLNPALSSSVKSALVPLDLELIRLSSMLMDLVLIRRGSWSTIIFDNRAVATSSMSFSVSLEMFSLCNIRFKKCLQVPWFNLFQKDIFDLLIRFSRKRYCYHDVSHIFLGWNAYRFGKFETNLRSYVRWLFCLTDNISFLGSGTEKIAEAQYQVLSSFLN